MNLFDLSGKVAVITGASRGIGRAIAETFAAHGAKVTVSSRSAEACAPAADAIRKNGGDALVVPAKISEKEQLQRLIDETLAKWGRIDVLVCNAAVSSHFGGLETLSDEVFDKMMRSNVLSNLWLAKMVRPGMAERKDGSIIFVSSIAGLRGSVTIGAYGISKAADIALARNLAAEYGRYNIRVNCIAPGLIKTDFAKALWENPERRKERENATPLGRLGEVEDVAGIAVLLAARAGAFVTGQVIVADGGITIAP